jgi:3-oxoacyl-[acyl-carrier protein] reductase
MEADFSGRTAIVTGAAKGIGEGAAVRLAELGANVVIADMNCAAANGLEERLCARGLSAMAVGTDVGKVQEVRAMAEAAVERFGGVDILFNNAGIFHSTPMEDITEDEWDNMSAINLKSVFFATQAVLPHMKKKGYGRIVNMSSLSGRSGGIANGLCYSATKAGVLGLSKGFASRLCGTGINVNAIAPGSTDTGIMDGLSDFEMARLMSKIPMGRFAQTKEIVDAVIFLCSEEASFITGAILDVNGGMYCPS